MYDTDFGILIAVRLSQLWNARYPILCKPACKVTVLSDSHFENAHRSSTFTPCGMSTEVRFLQLSKAYAPMVFTDAGILIVLNWQPSKALSPIDSNVDGSVTDDIVLSGNAFSPKLYALNALFPMLLTPSGITMPSNKRHLAKAEFPMDFSVGGRVIDFLEGQ
jgi:hypothetical protein